MKHKKVFRMLAVALSLALLLVAIPASPALAAYSVSVENNEPESDYYEEPMGEIDDEVKVIGSGFTGGVEYYIYFSSQPAEEDDEIDEDVTVYDFVGSPVANIYTNIIYAEFDVPDELDEGPDPDEDEGVHGGTYYIYVTRATQTAILAKTTFYVTGVAEITDFAPDEGTVGTEVEITGEGLAPDEDITVEYDGDDITDDVDGAFTDEDGSFEMTFLIPESTYGEHTITITGEDSLAELEVIFFVEPEISVNPVEGEAASEVTITGTGFDRRNGVDFYFDGEPINVVWLVESGGRTNSDGTFAVEMAVPEIAPGNYTIVAEDEDDNDIAASATFAVILIMNPTIDVTPTSGNVDDEVTVSGTEFSADDTVTIYFDGDSIGTAPTDEDGNFTLDFDIPASPAGSHTIKAEDTEDYSDTATITIEPEMSLTPTTGAMGDDIAVSGSGFGDDKAITILYGAAAVTPTTPITTNPDGSFSGSFDIPGIPAGSYTVTVTDGTNSLTISFVVVAGVIISPTSGKVSDAVGIAGYGFGANKTVTILFNNSIVTPTVPIITGPAGSFSGGSFDVPNSPAGMATITISDGSDSVTTSFVVESDITISKTTSTISPGYVGMELTISGTGYAAEVPVEVTYASDPEVLYSSTTNSNGSFTADFNIPPSASGEHTVTVSVDGVEVKQYTFVMESTPPAIPEMLETFWGGKAEQPISFKWEEVSDDSLPVTYNLEVATDENFTNVVVDKPGLTETQYTLTEAEELEPVSKNEPYYWRVNAEDSADNVSGWFAIDTFYVGGGWPGWLMWLWIGLGAVVIFIFAIWLGRRIAFSSY